MPKKLKVEGEATEVMISEKELKKAILVLKKNKKKKKKKDK